MMLISANSWPDLMSNNILPDHQIPMQKFDGNYSSPKNSFDLVETHYNVSNLEHLKVFTSIEALLNMEVDDIYLLAYLWEQLDILYPWNLYRTVAATDRGSSQMDNLLFGPSRTKYCGADCWFNYDLEPHSWCEGHNCINMHLTEGHQPAVPAKAKATIILQSVIHPLTFTPYNVGQHRCY